MIEYSMMADDLLLSVRGFVTRSLGPLLERVKALEERPLIHGKNGADGLNGKDGEAGLAARDGADGRDGKSVSIDEVRELVKLATEAAFAGMPKPKDGIDGKDGAHGQDGQPGSAGEKGAAGIDGKDGSPGVEGHKGMDGSPGIGLPGEKGADGIDGPAGLDGADGLAGKDATPIDEDALVARIAEVAVKHLPVPRDGIDGKDADEESMMARVLKAIPAPKDGVDGKDAAPIDPERVRDMVKAEVAAIPRPENGRDGRDAKGKDGADGLSIDDFDIEQKDDRTIVVSLRNKDKQVSREIKLKGLPIDRGVYKSGAAYQEGDGITYGGSWWLAQKDTSNTPGDASGDWRLAVKRGRDGKDA